MNPGGFAVSPVDKIQGSLRMANKSLLEDSGRTRTMPVEVDAETHLLPPPPASM